MAKQIVQIRISLYEVIVVCKYVLFGWCCTEPCVFNFVSRDHLSNQQVQEHSGHTSIDNPAFNRAFCLSRHI